MPAGPVRRLGPGAVLVLASGCAALEDRPATGDSWRIEAVDHAGVFGSITIERGEIIPMPPEARAGQRVPGATQGILVRISYEPERASDIGIGRFDWTARIAADENEAVAEPGLMGLVSDARWPVEPSLGTSLAGEDPLAGWVVIAVAPEHLGHEILLSYQPPLDPVENAGLEARLITDIVIHAP